MTEISDKEIAELKAIDCAVPSHIPIPCMVFGWKNWLSRLIARLEYAETRLKLYE
jgi:hypothetical protein